MLLLSLGGTALALYLPYLSKGLVDRALIGRDTGALVRTIGIFTALTLASFGLNVASGLRYTRVSADILFDMRLALFQHLQRLSPRFYARMPLGQIVTRLNADIGELQRISSELALAWVGNLLFLAGSVAILVHLDAMLFLVSLVMLPPAVWALVRYRRRLERSIGDLRDHSAGIGTFLIESLQGHRVAVAHNAQEREAARFRSRNDAFVGSLMRMRRLTYLAGGLPGLLLAAGSSIVLLVGGQRVISGAMTMGTLVAFVAYQMRLVAPVQALMGLFASLASARVSLRRVHEILDVPPEVVEPPAAASLTAVRGEVTFEHVSFAFDRVPVLDDVVLRIAPGERVALVGRSGEGKSTIADLLLRQLDPDRGRITLDGHDLRELRLGDIRRHVVVVDQQPFLFNASIRENVRYARPEADVAAVERAARRAGLGPLVARLPGGLDAGVGEGGRALSAGERQRVAIARALLADPAVLVLDEATGALDAATERDVVEGYEELMAGRTTIVITHREALARRADRILALDGGRVHERALAAATG